MATVTWGAGLFDDDLAADMRDEWNRTVADGGTPVEASRSVRGSFEQDCAEDYDDGPVFWLVLASLQNEAGSLEPGVRDRALASIEQNREKWHDEAEPAIAAERNRVLGTLRAQLTG